MPRLLLIAAISYLLGSIPFGYLLVRIFRGEDVRRTGSGNIGATNVARKSPATRRPDPAPGRAERIRRSRGRHRPQSSYLSAHPASPTFRGERFSRRIVANSPSAAALAAFFAVVGHMFPSG